MSDIENKIYVQLPHVSPKLMFEQKVIIVGSSGNLKGCLLGTRIDSYDEVVRFNRAITKEFEEDVGTKTTLRVVNNHVFDNVEISAEGWSCQPANFIKNLKNKKILYIGPDIMPWDRRNKNAHSSNKLYLFNYGSVGAMKKKLIANSSNQWTIGTIIIGLCILSGITPTLVGFDLEAGPRTHYWETRPKNAGSHNISEEQKWLLRLEKENKIKILRRQ